MQITKELLLWQSLADCVESTLLHAMAEAASGGHEVLVRLCYEGWGEKYVHISIFGYGYGRDRGSR
jgi:hypothetical protein